MVVMLLAPFFRNLTKWEAWQRMPRELRCDVPLGANYDARHEMKAWDLRAMEAQGPVSQEAIHTKAQRIQTITMRHKGLQRAYMFLS